MTPKQLTKAREKLGLTKPELGQALGFTYEHILRMEQGKKRIQLATELAISWLDHNQQSVFEFGDYEIVKTKDYKRLDCYWLQHYDGEGMQVDIKKLNKLIKDFFEREF